MRGLRPVQTSTAGGTERSKPEKSWEEDPTLPEIVEVNHWPREYKKGVAILFHVCDSESNQNCC